MLLLIGAAVAAFSLLFVTLYLPLQKQRSALAAQVQQAELDLLAARRHADEIRSAGPPQNDPVLAGPDRSLLARVDEGLREAGLSGVLARIEPEGDRRVRLWLEDAPFDGLIAWLERASVEQGVRLIDASVDRDMAPGLVSVRLTLEQGG
jgi:general secretion pathway protein M